MNFMSHAFRQSARLLAATTMATVLSVSLPLASFGQEGVISRENRIASVAKTPEGNPKREVAKTETPARDENGGVVTAAPSATATAPAQQTQNPITQPLALSPEVGNQRV